MNRRNLIKTTFIIFFLGLIVLSCTSKSRSEEEYQNFYSEEEATKFYFDNFTFYSVMPDSTAIEKLIYFYNSKRGVFLIFFVKGKKYYIYEGMKSYFWEEFINSPSKGKFFNKFIRNDENYKFNLNIN
ncbi:MAG: KTSC domain-containing protein [Brevinematales bacterium]|nr:KTSC domain-containing protein [Brevinematales bacterium]